LKYNEPSFPGNYNSYTLKSSNCIIGCSLKGVTQGLNSSLGSPC